MDIDNATYPDSDVPGYSVGEVELIVENEDCAAEAAKKVVSFLRQHLQAEDGVAAPVGKIEHLLRTIRPSHFEALLAAGVVAPQTPLKR